MINVVPVSPASPSHDVTNDISAKQISRTDDTIGRPNPVPDSPWLPFEWVFMCCSKSPSLNSESIPLPLSLISMTTCS